MLTCSNCGALQPEGSAYCDECGAALKARSLGKDSAQTSPSPRPVAPAPAAAHGIACSACGAILPSGSAFCHLCGAPAASRVAQRALQTDFPTQRSQSAGAGINAATHQHQPSALQEALSPAPPPAPKQLRMRLVILPGGAELPLPAALTEIILGRGDPISRILPELDLTEFCTRDAGVSRRHARLFFQRGVLHLDDCNSTNHTYVNGQQVVPGQPRAIHSGDEIRLGRLKIRFVAD